VTEPDSGHVASGWTDEPLDIFSDVDLPGEEEPRGAELGYVDPDLGYDWSQAQDRISAASLDVLSIVDLLRPAGGAANIDLHAFAYLACLMSVYDGRPAADWGYIFTAVPPTLPYSPAIQNAADILVKSGLLTRDSPDPADRSKGSLDDRLSLTADGLDELAFIQGLSDVEGRAPYLEAAAATARMRSVPSVANALAREPGLAQATKTSSVRMLLREDSSAPLYQQFGVMEDLLGDGHANLVVPASLYLRFLDELAIAGPADNEGDASE
jgi:hypothetical protein